MFDDGVRYVSPVEQLLGQRLAGLPGAPVFIVVGEPHGRRTAAPQPSTEPSVPPPTEPSTGPLVEVLDGVPGPIPEDVPNPPSAQSVEDLPAGSALLRQLLETGAGHLTAAKAAYLKSCRQAAVQARELAAFAAQRPAAILDRPDEEVGAAAAASRAARPAVLTAVSEWAVDEVAGTFGMSGAAASELLSVSVTLVAQLSATVAALEDGVIGWAHARMLAEVLAPLTDPTVRAQAEERLLSGAAGRTVAQLKASARRAVARADAAAATRRLAAAIRERQVRMFPGEDGMATLSATLPTPVALACRSALENYAQACQTPQDKRTKDQRMVDCFADLILRPGASGRPPVQAQLQLLATVDTLTGGEQPGEIDGEVVSAVVVRELAHTLGLLPRPEAPTPDDPQAEAHPEQTAAQPTSAEGVSATSPRSSANEQAAADLAALLGVPTVAGTALTHLPTIAVIEEISGQLLALTDAGQLRRCATGNRGLGPPPATPGYRPATALQRFVRARDRRCRFPGCRTPAHRCDLDHNTPWPTGPTSTYNLCCLRRHHHRLSHQAPGWTMHRLPHGGLQWTTPGGQRITTHPPAYATDDPPPTAHTAPATSPQPRVDPPLTPTERVLGRPPPPDTTDDDPAPF
ncbi:MAG: putative endonuclease [Blastococcus sp.]|nr:putative endonuclease [Blastococcus sp.]